MAGKIERQINAPKVQTAKVETPVKTAAVAKADAAGVGGNKFSANPYLAEQYPAVYVGMGITAENVARKYGVNRADADAFVQPLQDAGLAVASIAAQSEAFRALLGAPDKDAIDAIIDLGASALALTVLVGGVCVYERRLPELGLDEFAKSAADACRLTPEHAERVIQAAAQGARTASDALAGPLRAFGAKVGEEVAVSLEYASHRYPHAAEGRMTALGGGAQLGHLLTAASQTLGLDVLAAHAGAPLSDDGPVPPWGAVATAAMAVAPPHRAGAAA